MARNRWIDMFVSSAQFESAQYRLFHYWFYINRTTALGNLLVLFSCYFGNEVESIPHKFAGIRLCTDTIFFQTATYIASVQRKFILTISTRRDFSLTPLAKRQKCLRKRERCENKFLRSGKDLRRVTSYKFLRFHR